MQNKHAWGEQGSTVPYGFDPSGDKLPLSDVLVQLVGRPNENAAASDTAAAGMNGRLQRVAQRLGGLVSLFPASLGAKLGAASLSIVPASDAVFVSVGPVAHGVAVAGAPIRIGAKALIANPTAVANLATVDVLATAYGAVVSKLYSIPEADWQYAPPAGGLLNKTTADTVKAAGAAGIRNYITGLILSADALGAATEFVIRDGAGGPVLFRYKIGTAGLPGGVTIAFPTPLRGSAATLVEIVTLTASVTGAVYANFQGYQAV